MKLSFSSIQIPFRSFCTSELGFQKTWFDEKFNEEDCGDDNLKKETISYCKIDENFDNYEIPLLRQIQYYRHVVELLLWTYTVGLGHTITI